MLTQCGAGPTVSAETRETDLRICELLLDAGADVNAKNPDDGTTAVAFCAQYGLDDMLRLLVRRGADIDLQSDTKVSPALKTQVRTSTRTRRN